MASIALPVAASRDRATPRAATRSLPSVLLGSALAYAAFSQGAFHPRPFATFTCLLAVAAAVALAQHRSLRAVRGLPAGALAVGAWSVVSATVAGDPGGAAGPVALAVCVASAIVVVRLAGAARREPIAHGVLAVGAIVAATGWAGIVLRAIPFGLVDQEIWRAASSLTYSNATAALLAPVALLCLSRLVHQPGDRATTVLGVLLLLGIAATLSRAGYLAFAIGAAYFALRCGLRRTVAATWGVALGAVVAFAGLLPSMPAASPARPLLAVTSLAAGISLAVVAPRLRARQIVAGCAALAVLTAGAGAQGWQPVGNAVGRIAGARVTFSSPDRAGEWAATWDQARIRPLTGVGPGRLELAWQGADGRSMTALFTHNEYLQLLAEQGVVGLAGVLALLVAAAVSLRRREGDWIALAAPAALLPLLLHSGLDFLWHIPVLPVLASVVVAMTGKDHV